MWHKAFFRWIRAQGRSPHAPGIYQKCLLPRRHSPLLGVPQAPGDKPNLLEGSKSLGEGPRRPKEISSCRDTLGQIRARLIWTGVFVGRPTLRASMAQGLFLGGTGRRAVAHTRPEFPKMPTAPSAFLLLGAPQEPGDKPNLPEGSKSLGGRPPEAVGKSPGTETHSARTASRQLGRPKCNPAPGNVQSEINLSAKWSGLEYLLAAPPYGQVWHKAFF